MLDTMSLIKCVPELAEHAQTFGWEIQFFNHHIRRNSKTPSKDNKMSKLQSHLKLLNLSFLEEIKPSLLPQSGKWNKVMASGQIYTVFLEEDLIVNLTEHGSLFCYWKWHAWDFSFNRSWQFAKRCFLRQCYVSVMCWFKIGERNISR